MRRPYISGVSSKHIAQGSGVRGVEGDANVWGAGTDNDDAPISERLDDAAELVEADRSCLKKHASPRIHPVNEEKFGIRMVNILLNTKPHSHQKEYQNNDISRSSSRAGSNPTA